ncbi:MAG: thioredoxin family protein [Saprospiraceae bacterium]|nr:thioredoxin family protein [Saprospiraceae bacterium]
MIYRHTKFIIGLILFTVISSQAQESLRFVYAEWEDILQYAQQEKRLIFVDGQTNWCRSCRWMEREVFTDSAVVDYYDNQFVNVHWDMENDLGQKWFKEFGIEKYPSLLFMDYQGNLVHKKEGLSGKITFLKLGKKQVDSINYEPSTIQIPKPLDFIIYPQQKADLKLIYFVAQDQKPAEQYAQKIRTVLTFLQEWIPQTKYAFRKDRLEIYYIRGQKNAADYDLEDLEKEVEKESLEEQKYLIFNQLNLKQQSSALVYAISLDLEATSIYLHQQVQLLDSNSSIKDQWQAVFRNIQEWQQTKK